MNLKLGALNCQGLLDKIENPEFQNLITNTDIFCVSETWLHDNQKVDIDGYKFYPQNRKTTEKGPQRGGIGIFIDKKIKKHVKILDSISSEYTIWCQVDKKFSQAIPIYI